MATMQKSKVKKVGGAVKKKPLAHPPYANMIKDAIVTLKERTGSSQFAIAKLIEDNHKKNLSASFKKIISLQLKRLVAAGQLVKVKNSFKVASNAKPKDPSKKPKKAVSAQAKKPKTTANKPQTTSNKPKRDVKPKTAASKAKTAANKPKSENKPKVSVKTPVKANAVKKRVATPVILKAKKIVQKAKSIKSPAKKKVVKNAKK